MDIAKLVEIQQIRRILQTNEQLLAMFEILLVICNNRLNDEKKVVEDYLENIKDTLYDDIHN